MAYGLGELLQSMMNLHEALLIQMNHSDDNPYVAIDYRPTARNSSQEQRYVIDMPDGSRGAIVPTANFDSTPFVRPMEYLLHSMGTLSVAMAQNIVRFEDPHINGGLPRFLAGSDGHGFGAVSKLAGSLLDRIQAETTLTRSSNLVVAGGQLEDVSNAGPNTARKMREALKLMYQLAAMQTLYAAQAVDLRRRDASQPLALGAVTQKLHADFRARSGMMIQDSETRTALAEAERLLKGWSP
ncbi:MAG: MIO-dependent tyrosine 2,3-aminomutase [Herbaspirillum frisingense]|uniref:MIO-dependent tyrosine 2,3-aminomutase n=1 Tax=Herbaspirillum frisingense TaxID=92645 RepID=A0A7V8FVU6_9BURK|nr:MAG: MIO-dependent tyrosine 2,3-aminomutase [Herbaspirillum frisingense]